MEPLGTDGGVQIARIGTENNEQAVVAALEQLFTGLRIGLATLTVQCCRCGTQLGEGGHVSVYAYRTVETPRWHLDPCRCLDCKPDEIATPTLGVTEARLRQAVGRDADPSWTGPLGEFVGEEANEHAAVPVRVYPSTIDGGES